MAVERGLAVPDYEGRALQHLDVLVEAEPA
jgi:hypothetical protein